MRIVRFNAVGVLGFAIQLGCLWAGLRVGLHYLPATALAVEAAILHNFVWHERWTWSDRPAAGRSRLARLARFHLLNGLVSLAGNLVVMRLLVGAWSVPALPANVIAVLICSIVNFLASDRLVFDPRSGDRPIPEKRGQPPLKRGLSPFPVGAKRGLSPFSGPRDH